MKKKRLSFILALAVMMVGSTACLKTRAQLRDDTSDEAPAPRPVAVHQGQESRRTDHSQESGGQYAIDELKSEFTRIEGRLEDLERGQKDLSTRGRPGDREEMRKIEERLVNLETALAELTESIKKLQESPVLIDSGHLFDKGKAQFGEENWTGASETLSTYLKAPKGKHTEEATFLRAESYYKLKQYKKAIVDYSKFPEKYPHSSRTPQALYRIGLSFDAMGMKDDAKGFYQELVEKYPKSAEAKKAKKKVK